MSNKSISTQCSMHLINKLKVKHKSVACNLIKTQEKPKEFTNMPTKPSTKTRSVRTQCYLMPLNLNKKPKTVDKLTNTDIPPKKFKTSTKPACTQTLILSWPPLFEEVAKIIDVQFGSDLCYQMKEDCNSTSVMQITTKHSVGLLSEEFGEEPITLLIWAVGQCFLNIIFKRPFKFNIINNGIINWNALIHTFKVITGELGHIFCSGINSTKFENATCTLPKSLMVIQYPFTRYQSTRCEVFYESEKNNEISCRKRKKVQCKHCVYVANSIAKSKRRKASEPKSQINKRQMISSNSRIKYLTQKSKAARLSQLQKNRSYYKERISNLKAELNRRAVILNKESSTETSNVEKILNEKLRSTPEESFNSGFVKIKSELILGD